jgi:DNA-binding IclR family transcriptional regulator/nitroimidazol reductase NimA-like FMN-containing flavoprotein (pyridoxamine 5'-phosphate oxidase superfamily)
MSETPVASSVERTLRLIENLLAEPDGLTPQQMVEALGTSRSSLFNLLGRLKALGYVEQAERRGRYRAGPRLTAWHTPPPERLQTLLSAFYQEAGQQHFSETLILAIPTPEGVLILGQVESPQPVRSVYTPGEVTHTLSAADRVLKTLPPGDVEQNGYALTRSPQLYELALPVCADGVTPRAAIVCSAPAYRWTEESLLAVSLQDLRAMAARLSYRFGDAAYTPYHRTQPEDLKPVSPMPPQNINEFLAGPWTARLACIRPDGKPHVIPVWQAWDGVHFTVIAWQGSQWAEYVLQNPGVSLTIDEPWPPFRRVAARGSAHAMKETSHQQLESLVQRLGGRYLGASSTTLKVENVRCVFQITIDTMRGWQGIPGSGTAQSDVER